MIPKPRKRRRLSGRALICQRHLDTWATIFQHFLKPTRFCDGRLYCGHRPGHGRVFRPLAFCRGYRRVEGTPLPALAQSLYSLSTAPFVFNACQSAFSQSRTIWKSSLDCPSGDRAVISTGSFCCLDSDFHDDRPVNLQRFSTACHSVSSFLSFQFNLRTTSCLALLWGPGIFVACRLAPTAVSDAISLR